MKRIVYVVVIALCFMLPIHAQEEDNPDCKDHPLFTRMPGSYITSCDEKEFYAYTFTVGDGKTQEVEGKYWVITYYPQPELKSKPSEIQILRNFENAVKRLGGKVVFLNKDESKETFLLKKDGKEVWLEVWAEFTGKYGFTIVQKEAMAQDIVANADAFLNDIRTTGHAAVYGIYFDTGKSDIKAESEQAIGEIAKLLKSDAGLKVHVVGHTDNVGGLEINMKLSQSRADAVVQALVRTRGITASRLKSFGAGPFAPVASNDTEEGRAKNRRVELVKQ
jgi:outer membrane protein OmpA-like peptidoglycan-associated protein